MAVIVLILCLWSIVSLPRAQSQSSYNPTILQDSRDLPKTDGRFGFLYRTEDGISHGAVGEPGGQVHGRFTYTDPTGLKVNFNYNAGSRATPGYNYNADPQSPNPQPPQQQQKVYNPPPVYEPPARPHGQNVRPPQANSVDYSNFNYRNR